MLITCILDLHGQYRNLVLGDEDYSFTFGTKTSDYFYALAVDRAQYKEKLLETKSNINSLESQINNKEIPTNNAKKII